MSYKNDEIKGWTEWIKPGEWNMTDERVVKDHLK